MNFTDEQLKVIFQAARIALSDAETFDDLLDSSNLSYQQMYEIREKLFDCT